MPIFTQTDSLYFETGWEPLHSRCHRRKLRLFNKIYNGLAPQYLHDLIPHTIQSTTIYTLRNGTDLIVPFCRLSSSFIHSSVREWDKLENSVHNLDTPLKFKRALLNNAIEINIVPKHFMYGPRKLNVILTQLQCSASFVNNDLFKSLNMRVKFGITVVRAIQTN